MIAIPSMGRTMLALARTGLLACSIISTIAFAQAPRGIELDPADSPVKCVVVPATSIDYPEGAALRKDGGTIRVKMTFASADRAPRTEIIYDTVGREFTSKVLERVERYRFPCFRPGSEAFVFTQEFAFLPGDGRRTITSPTRVDDARLARLGNCIKGMEQPPEYPAASSLGPRREKWQGTVIARIEFVAPDLPPRVELINDGGDSRFARVVKDYVEGYRVPCLTSADLPLKAIQPFRFRVAGAPTRVLKDTNLVTFVRGLDHLESERVRFDFTTMGCPFDVSFEFWRPHLNNAVREIERSDPNRAEFIEWLRRVDLKVPADVRPMILGDAMTISVPCTVLDLS